MSEKNKLKKILLIEDENDYYDIVSTILHREFLCNIERAKDGREALEKIFQNAYDLLILDIGLPAINGINVLKKIREKRISVPVLIFSVRSELGIIKDAVTFGISGYLVKPFEPAELINKIKNVFKE